MAIDKLLVIAADERWGEILSTTLPQAFPDVNLSFTPDWNGAYGYARRERQDLYLLASTQYLTFAHPDESQRLKLDVDALREIHPEANVALLTGGLRWNLDSVLGPLGIPVFFKSDRDWVEKMSTHYVK